MNPLLTDGQFNSIALILIAVIGIIPATLAAIWSRNAKSNSADALHEVKANGGMSDPDPTLKDYVKFVGENVESQGRRLTTVEHVLSDYLTHRKIMDSAFSQVLLAVNPDLDKSEFKQFF